MPSLPRNEGLFSSPEKRTFVLGLLLIVATLGLYNSVTHHPFVNFDDDRYVTDNAHVRAGLHWDTVKWAFTTFDEANWHPLTWLSHAVDCQLFGLNPMGHHYTSVLLHALNAVLLFWLLWRATGSTDCSLMVAALFALHPMNVESVAWVAERKSVLSMLFLLLGMLAYDWYAQKPALRRYAAVAGLFGCGLMAKPMVITFPFVLLLWDYWPLRRLGGAEAAAEKAQTPTKVSWLIIEKAPLFILSAVSAVVTVKAQHAGDAIGSLAQYPLYIRLENAVVSYLRYIEKALWPANLSPMYPLVQGSVTPGLVITAAIVILGITAGVVLNRRRSLIVGWLWFLGTMVPMIGLVQVGNQAMADRYAYLPFVGLFIAICWGVAELTERYHVPAAGIAATGAVVLLAFGIVAHKQIGYWSDNVALWSRAVQVTKSFIAEDNLGGALLEQGRQEEAMPHFEAAAAIDPTDPMSRLNLAAYAHRKGHPREAIQQYTLVVNNTRDPRLRATAFSDMGYAYREVGFEAAVKLRPRNLRAWLGLGLVAEKSGNYSEAVNAYSQVVALQSWDLGYYFLARALKGAGQLKESEAAMQQARQLSENFDQMQQAAESLSK
jgi:tetratricopeptide (TPR) repeat protein